MPASPAAASLAGAVFKPVGYATHYHTDWVVPYWQSSLDKIAAVNTHLFFRWTGWWGTPPAFSRHVSADEPVIAALAPYSDAHKDVAALSASDDLYIDPVAAATPVPPALATDENSFLLTLDAHKMTPDGFAQLAARTCGDRPYCKVMAWSDKGRTPTALPLQPAQIAAMSFSYLRDRAHGFDKALWNCTEFRRADVTQCMKQQIYLPVAKTTDSFKLENAPGSVHAPPIEVLEGVRRKGDVPAAKATPTAPEGR